MMQLHPYFNFIVLLIAITPLAAWYAFLSVPTILLVVYSVRGFIKNVIGRELQNSQAIKSDHPYIKR